MPDTNDDPLLEALLYFGKLHSRPINRSGVLQCLPLWGGKLTPQMFPRAAERAGFNSKMVKRPLKRISPATYPAILLLNDNEVAILTEKVSGNCYKVILPSAGGGEETLSADRLGEVYSGIAIFVKPAHEFETRAEFRAQRLGKNWFWGTLWRFRSFYFRVCVATVVINFLALASSIFMMNVYDRVVPNEAVDTLFVMAMGVGIAYVFEFILKSLRTHFVDRAGHRIDLILGSEIFGRILGMHFGDRPESAGALASQARGYDSLREFFTSATIAAMADLPFTFVFVGVIYLLGGPAVALPVIAGLTLALIVGLFMQLPIRKAVSRSYLSSNQRQALMVEGIQSLERIKATGSESEIQARMEEIMHVSAKSEIESRGYSHLAMNMTALLQHVVSTVIIISAFFAVRDRDMTMGAMIASVILSGRAMAPMALVASLLTRMQLSLRSLSGLDQLMELRAERDERGAQYISVPEFSPSIEARQLKFRYDSDGALILDELNITIQPGERVALLGKTGSGKSSLLRLLMGFQRPTDGSISISGIELSQLDPAELRRNIGYVPQDPGLLYGTLRSNLLAGCPWVEDYKLLEAIDIAGLGNFIRSLPRGIDQPVSENGNSLSGGQKQAVSLARALIVEPELLLFDEPTSAMDSGSERRLIEKLRAYLDGDSMRTLLVATHKRSILSLVDRVIVMEDGKVIADGPKQQVVRREPVNPSQTFPGARISGAEAGEANGTPDVALPN